MPLDTMPRIAVLDDYQRVARTLADWSSLQGRARVDVFHDHVRDPEAVIERLREFDVLCVMRERTPLPAAILDALPRLKLIVSTGPRNASIDVEAAKRRGIEVRHTGYAAAPTVELTWALILASARHLPEEIAAVRAGGWQLHVGDDLHGRTLGILGLGSIGRRVAAVGQAFGMNTIAWSQNLTAEAASEVGVERVEREALFERADILTIHLVLSDRTRGLVGEAELARMKPTARLVNTSRGPIVSEPALIAALREHRIAGAALDVFDQEPLPADHPYRALGGLLATPHIGYVSSGLYRTFYGDTVRQVGEWLDGRG